MVIEEALELLSKAKCFISAEGTATDQKSDKQVHQVGKSTQIIFLTEFCPSQGLVHPWVHNSSWLAIVWDRD
jgi:hypothetical protein